MSSKREGLHRMAPRDRPTEVAADPHHRRGRELLRPIISANASLLKHAVMMTQSSQLVTKLNGLRELVLALCKENMCTESGVTERAVLHALKSIITAGGIVQIEQQINSLIGKGIDVEEAKIIRTKIDSIKNQNKQASF